MEQQPFDTLEKQLREPGNIPVPGSLLKDIQARLGLLTPEWAERQYQLGRKIRNLNEEAREKSLVMALGHFQNALHVYTAEAFPHQRVKVLCASGRTYRDLGDLFEKDRLTHVGHAVTCYKEAQQIGRERHLSERLTATLDRAIRECYQQRIQELKYRADVEKTMADFLRLTDQRVSALANYNQALRLYRLVESRLDEAIVLKDIGDVHASLQHLNAAMQQYHQALACFRQMDHRHDVATVLQAMGDVAHARSEDAVAESYYREALDLFRQVGDNFSEASILASLGTQGEEVDLYRKVGETNISHMRFRLFDKRVAVLDRPVHYETVGRTHKGAPPDTSPMSKDPEREKRIVSPGPSPTVSGVRKQRKQAKRLPFILLALMILIIVATATKLASVSLTSHSSCTTAANRLPSSGIGVVKTGEGECIGLSDGTVVFDINQPGRTDSALKQQAAAALRSGDREKAIALFQQAVKQDESDAEARIHLEDLHVLKSGQPYITLIVGTKITGDLIDLTGERRILQGAYIAQQEHNQACRDKCILVRLLIANTGNDAENANTVANQIVQAAKADPTIVGVEGWSVSQDTVNMVSTLRAARIPMVSSAASSDLLTGISPYFFRIAPPDSSQGTLAASYVVNTLHAQRIALFVDTSNAYSSSLAGVFKQHVPGENIAVVQPYIVGTYAEDRERARAALQEIARYRPDLIYFAGYSEDARSLLEELSTEKQFTHLPVMGGDDLYNLVGDTDQHVPGLDRLFFTAFASPDEWQYLDPAGKEPAFFQEYAQIFASGELPAEGNTPAGEVILAYDALRVLLQAVQTVSLNKKGPLTGQDLQRALKQMTGSHALQGVSGQITFGPDGDPQEKTVVMLRTDQQGRTYILSTSGIFLR